MIDWKKFGEFAKNCHNIQTGENIGANFNWDEVENNPDIFVDSPYNMVVVKFMGIVLDMRIVYIKVVKKIL